MIEILDCFDFGFGEKPLKTFHLAEGPGGFIEAMVNHRKNRNDRYYGFTLMDKHHDVPKWRKMQQFLRNNKNIILEYGPKQDGNLYYKHNLQFFRSKYSSSCDFVTADGGFDYSIDFNKQEEHSVKLIYCQILYALIIQKVQGSFVLKVFDTFFTVTAEMLYLLSYFYEEVHLYKPQTSREANSEKYVICKRMREIPNRQEIINRLCLNFDKVQSPQYVLQGIFSSELNSYFVNKLQEINAIYGQQQIENIVQTLNFIREDILNNKEKANKIKLTNIKRCIQWCRHHKQPYLHDLNV